MKVTNDDFGTAYQCEHLTGRFENKYTYCGRPTVGGGPYCAVHQPRLPMREMLPPMDTAHAVELSAH